MKTETLRLAYDRGTVTLSGVPDELTTALPQIRRDERTGNHRMEACHYRAVVEFLRKAKIPYEDSARAYQPIAWRFQSDRTPFPHQLEAIEAWWNDAAAGVVVLPTGSGKTFTAMLAIRKAARPALIVTPTIELLHQWYNELGRVFGEPIGLIGGGHHEVQPLTVTTYDSAHIHMERLGDRFGLLVFDECHHLPGETYRFAAVGSIAPFRLGLTATPERADGGEDLYTALIGPIVYRREIKELSGDLLAGYRTERVYVDLSAEEQQRYTQAREVYRQFIAQRNISLSGANGWQRFIFEASRSAEGRGALRAYREYKTLERAAAAKLATLDDLLKRHAGDRILIFTADNATVYQIARRFLIPAITGQTKAKERKKILERFHSGEYPILVTCQVLNEGVDVPAANIGIVLSGTGSIRENVQRLGRLLRKHGDKQATLYEVIARNTAEEFTSERRRRHHAFR